MLNTNVRYQVAPHVVTREISDGLMLVDVQSGSAYKLNHVGAAIWRLFDGARDIDVIASEMERLYQVARDKLAKDVEALVTDLRAKGLIQAGSHE
jgi:hypothetical protein